MHFELLSFWICVHVVVEVSATDSSMDCQWGSWCGGGYLNNEARKSTQAMETWRTLGTDCCFVPTQWLPTLGRAIVGRCPSPKWHRHQDSEKVEGVLRPLRAAQKWSPWRVRSWTEVRSANFNLSLKSRSGRKVAMVLNRQVLARSFGPRKSWLVEVQKS